MKNYAYSLNEEHFQGSFSSRENALAEARATYPDEERIWTGEMVEPIRHVSASDVIEDVAVNTADFSGDWADGYLTNIPKDAVEELENALQEVWDKWEKKHKLAPNWFNIINVEEHELEEGE